MGAWREVGEGMRMPCQYHTKAERDTLNAQRQDFLKAQKLQQKTAGWSSTWDHTLLGVLGTFPTKMTGSIQLNMLISKTGWSQQRLSPPCNLNAPLKVISSGTAFQLHSPWTIQAMFQSKAQGAAISWSFPGHPSPESYECLLLDSQRQVYIYYYSNSCGLQLGAILQKRSLLLDLNVCFLSSYNFPYPLNSIAITSSPIFLQGSTVFKE